MVVGTEIITIERCPHCEQSHRYRLAVQRAMLFKKMGPRAEFKKTKINRLFTCPVTSEDFQASVTLFDSGEFQHIGQVLGAVDDE